MQGGQVYKDMDFLPFLVYAHLPAMVQWTACC